MAPAPQESDSTQQQDAKSQRLVQLKYHYRLSLASHRIDGTVHPVAENEIRNDGGRYRPMENNSDRTVLTIPQRVLPG